MRKLTFASSIGAIALFALVGFGQPARATEKLELEPVSKVKVPGTFVTGTLTAMSSASVPATLTVKAGATIYTAEVTSATTIVRRYNGSTDLGEFLVGDTVEVRGTLSNDVANTISATKLKNVSIQRVGGTFKGKVVSRNCDAGYFTFKPEGRDEQSVYFTANTKFIRGGEKISCASLVANERVKVIGLWRKADARIDADRVIVDMRTISGTISTITLTNGGLPATLVIDRKGKVKSTAFQAATSESSETTTESWTVNITSTTKLYRKYMKIATIEEMLVGDKVDVRGTVAEGNVMNARVLRNNSLVIKYGDMQGTVLSVDADAKTFVLRTKEKKLGDVIVTVTDATKYVDENGMRVFTDLTVGDKLKVLGTYNSSTKKIAATRVFFKEAQETL
ncbi:MAG: DUF5666 domain-containing protein [Patescibacteria group bacterium]